MPLIDTLIQCLCTFLLFLLQIIPRALSERRKRQSISYPTSPRPSLFAIGSGHQSRSHDDPFDAIRKGNCAVFEADVIEIQKLNHPWPKWAHLLCAAFLGEDEQIEKFIDKPPWRMGVNPAGLTFKDAATSPSGVTALHTASLMGNISTVKLLLSAGADPNAETRNGWTPVHVALAANNNKTLDLLLCAGGDITKAARGWTALHVCTANNNFRMCKKLLGIGADYLAKTDEGKKARDYIKGFGKRTWMQKLTRRIFLQMYKGTLAAIPQKRT